MELYGKKSASIAQQLIIVACVTHNAYALLVPAFLFVFFYFLNGPKLDAYLRERYGEDFAAWEKHTKKLIPFVL